MQLTSVLRSPMSILPTQLLHSGGIFPDRQLSHADPGASDQIRG